MSSLEPQHIATAVDRKGTEVPPGFVSSDVPGAPFSIGQELRVRPRADIADPDDETFRAELYAGRVGCVVAFRFECIAGEKFPDDPIVKVRFADGTEDLFWSDELEASGRPS